MAVALQALLFRKCSPGEPKHGKYDKKGLTNRPARNKNKKIKRAFEENLNIDQIEPLSNNELRELYLNLANVAGSKELAKTNEANKHLIETATNSLVRCTHKIIEDKLKLYNEEVTRDIRDMANQPGGMLNLFGLFTTKSGGQ